MLKGKPVHRSGEDLRDLPTCTISEAALFLGISPRTAGYWFNPEKKILKPTARIGDIALLSFRDLAEAYVLAVLTKFYDFPLRSLKGNDCGSEERNGDETTSDSGRHKDSFSQLGN